LKNKIAELRAKGVRSALVEEARWGPGRKIELPGGGQVGLYQPKHPLAIRQIRSDAWPGGDPAIGWAGLIAGCSPSRLRA
jgi:hypothetical protein